MSAETLSPAEQRTSTVTSGTGTTTSAWLAWNMMMWSTLWPSAQQTRSCCCPPATTPPLKCGARHAWCASLRHSNAPLGLANCFPPCLATEVLIWMVNPDRTLVGVTQEGSTTERHSMSRAEHVRSRNWGLHMAPTRTRRIHVFLSGPFAGRTDQQITGRWKAILA